MELAGAEKPGFVGWMSERKPMVLAAAGGFAAVVVVGIFMLSAHASAQPSQATPPFMPGTGSAPTQMASSGSS